MKKILGMKKLLKIYIDTDDKYENEPLWQVILNYAKSEGLNGATVYKSIGGMGLHSEIKSYTVVALSQSLPLVIEIIDDKRKIEKFLKKLDTILEEGLVTMSDVDVIRYKHKSEIS